MQDNYRNVCATDVLLLYYRGSTSVLQSDDFRLDCSNGNLCTTDVLALYYRATTSAPTAPRSDCVLQTYSLRRYALTTGI